MNDACRRPGPRRSHRNRGQPPWNPRSRAPVRRGGHGGQAVTEDKGLSPAVAGVEIDGTRKAREKHAVEGKTHADPKLTACRPGWMSAGSKHSSGGVAMDTRLTVVEHALKRHPVDPKTFNVGSATVNRCSV